MRHLILYTITFTAFIRLPAFATVINIPEDYPTIQQGIDASSDGDTVLVQPGTYVQNINFNGHNIVLGSLYLLTGDTAYIEETVIDGNSSGSVVAFESGEDSTAVTIGFTIRNGFVVTFGAGIYCTSSSPTIINNIIRDNVARTGWGGSGGGGIYVGPHSHPLISQNTIMGNQVTASSFPSYSAGGGIFCDSCSATIIQNTIIQNFAAAETDYGGGIACFYSNPVIENNIVGRNDASEGAGICVAASDVTIRNNTVVGNSGWYGGGLSCIMMDSLTVTNTILWRNTGPEGPEIFYDGTEPVVEYCDISGGWEGEGNIDCDPLFCDPEDGNYYLAENSCCAGAGENGEDIGAFGVGCEPTGIMDERLLSIEYSFHQNYPNPFNATTVIRYNLSGPSDVIIEIYDILGRKVETLVQEKQLAGYHHVMWDAIDRSSGIYFYRIQAGDHSETRKMVLLK